MKIRIFFIISRIRNFSLHYITYVTNDVLHVRIEREKIRLSNLVFRPLFLIRCIRERIQSLLTVHMFRYINMLLITVIMVLISYKSRVLDIYVR